MNKISKLSSYAMITMLLLGVFFAITPVKAATTMELTNPVDGTHQFNFTTATKNVGDTFVINLSVVDVVGLFTFQVGIKWDPSLLEFKNFTYPSDYVFAGQSAIVVPPDTSVLGYVVAGASAPSGGNSFNGTGTLALLELKIIQGVSQGGPTHVSCTIIFDKLGVDTFMQHADGTDISFTTVDAVYDYKWVAPSTRPRFYLLPSTIKPAKLGDLFSVDVMVTDVDPNWNIVALQFSIMWNTTLMTPVAPFYVNGTFFEGFQYAPLSVIYATDFNVHNRPPPQTPIAPDYNYSTIGELMLPDAGANYTFHPPFPSAPPAGRLATLYFQAIFDTIAPVEYWSSINFIAEDFLVLTQYSNDIGYDRADPAAYRAPVRVLGLSIDLYTQYQYPYGGQGGNQTSDGFGPQQQVELFALVTYNEYPVQQKLVGFEIFHQGATKQYDFWREGTTNADGIAHVSFRLPWPCANPVAEIFGWWYVNATVEVAEQKVVDNLKFYVWWPVGVLSIEPKGNFVQRKTGGDPMQFTVTYGTYSMQIIHVIVTATIYDELGFFIGSAYKVDNVGWGSYGHDGMMITYSWNVTIPMPTNAVVGKGIAYGNAFSDFPWNLGTPYCPEVTNTIDFYITKP